jgi:iron complex transport system ATP-binding protein
VSVRYTGGSAARLPKTRTPSAPLEAPLRQASLELREGEIVSVLGPNGAGKSTFLRVAAGALEPFEGEALLLGRPMRALDRRWIARHVAVVGQAEKVAFGFTVREVVAMGRAPHQGGWMRASERDRGVVERAIERCDLAPVADRPAQELSGGEQKRVAIARALAQEPRVLLLDEPSAFLDVRHQVELYELLSSEAARSLLACIVVVHDFNVAAQYASRVALMKAGAIIALGSAADVMTEDRLREVFDVDLQVGALDGSGDRFFLPLRKRASSQSA